MSFLRSNFCRITPADPQQGRTDSDSHRNARTFKQFYLGSDTGITFSNACELYQVCSFKSPKLQQKHLHWKEQHSHCTIRINAETNAFETSSEHCKPISSFPPHAHSCNCNTPKNTDVNDDFQQQRAIDTSERLQRPSIHASNEQRKSEVLADSTTNAKHMT